MKNAKLSSKLLFLTIVLLSIAVLIAWVGMSRLGVLDASVQQLGGQTLQNAISAGDIRTNLLMAIRAQKIAIMSQTDADRISLSVENQNRSAQTISQNISDANQGVGHIARSISEVASTANMMARNIAEASRGAVDVSRNVGEAARASSGISESITQVSAAARETNSSATGVTNAAKQLDQIAGELRNLIAKFKISRNGNA